MDAPRIARTERRLDQAARAAWLYYIAGRTQDEIAVSLNLSRQAVQRLVALAVEAKLIKFRLDHPVEAAMQLAERLRARFDLRYSDVVPSDAAGDGSVAGIAAAAAGHLETYLLSRAPLVLAFSTGRTLRALVGEVEQHPEPAAQDRLPGRHDHPGRPGQPLRDRNAPGRPDRGAVLSGAAAGRRRQCRGVPALAEPSLLHEGARARGRGRRGFRRRRQRRLELAPAPGRLHHRRRGGRADRQGSRGRDRRLGL